jgi:hypothetical protein
MGNEISSDTIVSGPAPAFQVTYQQVFRSKEDDTCIELAGATFVEFADTAPTQSS